MMTARQTGVLDGRLGTLSKAIILLWAILFVRFFSVAVLSHERFVLAAEKQHIGNKEVLPLRGEILGSSEEPLATNVVKYAVLVVPKNVKDKEGFARLLAPPLGMAEAELLQAIDNDKLYVPPVKRGLTEEEAQRIEKLNLIGVIVIPESHRFYPEGSVAAHILGFVNASGEGQYGLEGFYNEILKGLKGAVSYERDPRGRNIGVAESLAPARNGTSLVLTIDRNLQYIVEQFLSEAIETFRADSGSVIVLNAKNGEIMAMASTPSFDPGAFQEVGETSRYLNPVTQSTWEPGSVMKPLTMAAALNEGLVSPETTETFGNSVVVDSWTIHTAQNKAFGRETMTQVLENSDNVAMVWVTEKLGNEKFYTYLKSFGLDERTSVDLQGETDPEILPLKQWRNIHRATMSFGQGIALTPLHLTVAYAALGNGGKLLWPHVVKAFVDSDGKERTVEPREIRQVISPETSAKISAMLVSAVERGHGKRARVTGYQIAGKTGTAQVPSPDGGYDETKHVGSFCGYAPAKDPLFAMCVRLDTPKNVDWAEASAAPLFGKIAGWALAHYNIPPAP